MSKLNVSAREALLSAAPPVSGFAPNSTERAGEYRDFRLAQLPPFLLQVQVILARVQKIFESFMGPLWKGQSPFNHDCFNGILELLLG